MNTLDQIHHRLSAIAFLLPMLLAANLQAGEIHDAAAAGDLAKVRTLLAANPALLEAKDDSGNTPLISACWGPPALISQEAVANFLIDQGANINARNSAGGSPLYFSTESYALVQRLLDKGADVNVRAFGDRTPLQSASNLKVAKLLIDRGADLNARAQNGTIIHSNIFREGDGSVEKVQLLLESDAKFQPFCYGNMELHMAAVRGATNIAQLLIKHGADINGVNEYGHTPLFYAARHGHQGTADALIAAGADKRTIVETNYGKAPQLDAVLKDGEAYLWYLGAENSPYDSYAVKTKNHLIIFNPFKVDESPEAGLANGILNPKELAGLNITILFTYRYDGIRRNEILPALRKALPGATFIHNAKPAVEGTANADTPLTRVATPNASLSVGEIRVHTIPAMRQLFFEREGLAYLVEADGVKIFHSGLHASGNDPAHVAKYNKEIDFLKPFGPIDIAILPIKGRHLVMAYKPYLYLLDQLAPKAVYLIGDDLAAEEHKKCIEVLKARNIPIAYPEGGIAVGERFHFMREQALAVGAAAKTEDIK